MHISEELRDSLMEARLRRAYQREQLHDLYVELVALDPEGADAWYDNDANVAPMDFEQAIRQVTAQIEKLKEA
jgi:hypothetical protein